MYKVYEMRTSKSITMRHVDLITVWSKYGTYCMDANHVVFHFAVDAWASAKRLIDQLGIEYEYRVVPRFEPGDKVRITGNVSNHMYMVGDVVKVVSAIGTSYYETKIDGDRTIWLVRPSDIEPLESQPEGQ